MSPKSILIFALAMLPALAAGCQRSAQAGKAASQVDQPPPPVSRTVFAPYVQALDKAKRVGNTLQAEKRKTDRLLQQAEAGTSAAPAPATSPPPPR